MPVDCTGTENLLESEATLDTGYSLLLPLKPWEISPPPGPQPPFASTLLSLLYWLVFSVTLQSLLTYA